MAAVIISTRSSSVSVSEFSCPDSGAGRYLSQDATPVEPEVPSPALEVRNATSGITSCLAPHMGWWWWGAKDPEKLMWEPCGRVWVHQTLHLAKTPVLISTPQGAGFSEKFPLLLAGNGTIQLTKAKQNKMKGIGLQNCLFPSCPLYATTWVLGPVNTRRQ